MDYWRMVLRRAVRETVTDTKRDTWAAMVVLVGPVLASGVLWLLLGYALPDSAVWARMIAAAVPLLLMPIALVMRLAAVPAALHCEAAERIAELEQQLTDLESTRARDRATLMRFYSDAQPILDRGFDIAPIDLAGFISEIEIWISSTATWIAEHMGEAALSRFTDRSGWRSAHFPAALNPDHGRVISLLGTSKNLCFWAAKCDFEVSGAV
jgi:hypothetical protein